MKLNIMKTKYIWLLAGLIGFSACSEEADFLEEEVVAVELPALTAGSADFSNYVALGASFTAGFTDGALFKAAQENSFPNLLSKMFANASGGPFTQPLMADNTGAMAVGSSVLVPYRLIFNGEGPQRLDEFYTDLGAPAPTITTDPTVNLGSTFNNVGVPGAKSFHVTFAGYGTLNPYFGRMATSAGATMLGEAAKQDPSFFTLSEIGGNDVLSYATSGGMGVDQTGNPNAAEYGTNDITDPGLFGAVLTGIVAQLTANGAKGVITNVPYITSLPHFTQVPNNALVLDAEKAANLTGFYQAVAGIFTQALIGQSVPPASAQALAAQYAITFNEGPNRFLIDVPVTPSNPLGFRQMTENELLLLTIDQDALKQGYGSAMITPEVLQVLGKLQQNIAITPEEGGLVLGAVSGIDDHNALDSDELMAIKDATDAYNSTIASVASTNGLALVDLNAILIQASTTGIKFDNYTLNTALVRGGLVSLDGIHLTARGYALMANKFLEAIDATYGSNFIASGNVTKAYDYQINYAISLQ